MDDNDDTGHRSSRDMRLAAKIASVAPRTPEDAARVVESLAFGNLQLEDSRLDRASVAAAVRRTKP
jgi:hypothetical protein